MQVNLNITENLYIYAPRHLYHDFFSKFISLLNTKCNSMFYILGFQVDKHELYRPSNVPGRGSFVKAFVASVRIVAYKLG